MKSLIVNSVVMSIVTSSYMSLLQHAMNIHGSFSECSLSVTPLSQSSHLMVISIHLLCGDVYTSNTFICEFTAEML